MVVRLLGLYTIFDVRGDDGRPVNFKTMRYRSVNNPQPLVPWSTPFGGYGLCAGDVPYIDIGATQVEYKVLNVT